MLLGPVFSAELVTTARRTRYFFVRVIYATILLMILWGTYESVTYRAAGVLSIRQSAELAQLFFGWFAFLQLAAVLLLGPALAAGAIATERERRTIEYLFVTHLSNREIVLDKLAARLLLIGYLTLVGMPVVWIFRLLGGISAGLLLLSFLVTASTMITVAAVSVCISVWSPRARDAVLRAYLVLIAAILLPLIILGWLSSGIVSGWFVDVVSQVNQWCLTINPLWVTGAALGWGGRVAGAAIDWTIVQHMALGQLAIAAVCVVSATFAVRRVHTRSVGGAPRRRWKLRLPRWRPALGRHPMFWKELFAGGAVRLGAAGRIAMMLVVLGVTVTSIGVFVSCLSRPASMWGGPAKFYSIYGVYMGTLVGTGIVILLAALSATSVTSEKERQSWDALLATPLSARQIVAAKILGSLYAVRWLFALLLAVWGPMVLLDLSFVLVVLPLVFGTLCVLAFYASSLGVLLSITCRTSLRAMAATLATVIFAGGGYFFTCCMPVMMGSGDGPSEIIAAPCIPFLLALPAVLYVEPSGPWELIAAYLLGVMLYSVAAVLLTVTAIVNFDQLTGRTHLDGYPRSSRVTPTADRAG